MSRPIDPQVTDKAAIRGRPYVKSEHWTSPIYETWRKSKYFGVLSYAAWLKAGKPQ